MSVRYSGVVLAAVCTLLASAAPEARAIDTLLSFGGAPGRITWSKTSGGSGRMFAGNNYGDSTLADVSNWTGINESGVTWQFGADFVAGSSRVLANGIQGAEFRNGYFSFAGSSGLILAGTFSTGMLVSNFGALTFSVGGNQVSYTGGSALTGGSYRAGDFAIGISGHGLRSGWSMNAMGDIVTTGFTGEASGTFDASSSVPEPSEWAAMGILATGLTGLIVRARRRS